MSAMFDFIVIGKGMMGAAAARHLTASGARVALIGPDEPRSWPAHEGVFASHYDNGRITRTIDGDPDWALLARRSIARYGEIAARSGLSFYTEVGCLIAGAAGGTYLQAVDAAASGLGVEIDHLDPPSATARFPYLALEPGDHAIYEATGAGHVNPRALVAAETVCAMLKGAVVVNREATGLVETADGVAVTTIDGAVHRAGRVLVATGGFAISPALLPRRPAMRVMGRTVLFAEVAFGDMDRLSAMPSVIRHGLNEADGFYLLPPIVYPDGRTYLKIGGDPDDVVLSSEHDIRAWFRGGRRAEAARHLSAHLSRILPDVVPASTHFGPCVVSMTETGVPYIGFTDSDRVALLTGGNGAAAKSCDEIGRLGASLLMNGTVDREGYGCTFDPLFA